MARARCPAPRRGCRNAQGAERLLAQVWVRSRCALERTALGVNKFHDRLELAPLEERPLCAGVTVMRAVHIAELRTARDAVYKALGRARPT